MVHSLLESIFPVYAHAVVSPYNIGVPLFRHVYGTSQSTDRSMDHGICSVIGRPPCAVHTARAVFDLNLYPPPPAKKKLFVTLLAFRAAVQQQGKRVSGLQFEMNSQTPA